MGDSASGFFSSFEDGDPAPGTGTRLRVHVDRGPTRTPAAKPGVGWTGRRALHYRTSAAGQARTGLFTVALPVTEHTELSYVVLPELDAELTYRATYVALDVEFDDGTTLAELGAVDQYGFPLTARGQGEAKALYADQWNLVRCRLGAVAAGRTARAIVLTTDAPAGTGELAGWLDDIRIAERPAPRPRAAVDHVRTTRGTHSSRQFSRGNTIPATAVPNGFNFWTPITDARALDWLYSYHQHNTEENLPALQAIALSHQPSPWMGDRHTFQVMPGTGQVEHDPRRRALAFRHEDEIDRPYHYGVRFTGGVTADLAPTDHGAILRFTFPGDGGHVLFDNVRNRGGLRVDPATGTVTGHTWVRSRLSTGARRMFVYATVDRPARAGGRMHRPCWRTVTGYLAFAAPEVTMRVATSLISLAQARRNLELELPPALSFDQVRDQARARWQDLLGRVELEGATEEQLTTFYSGLYRLFLYPNSGHENSGTAAAPEHRHASPVVRRWWPSTRTRTGAKVLPGRISVNHGFWDTYRTVWPAYALLAPDRCGELVDGFVQQYREGGWIARWSSPGYADLMTGTSSDVAFADAFGKGVRDVDVQAGYDAALRNATVTPPNRHVGRKGLAESIFLGHTPTTTKEGLSWAVEGCVNDFGLAEWSRALFEAAEPDDPRRAEYRDNAEYFRHRARHYVHHFDRRIGFFQGRDAHGRWRHAPETYDPRHWGPDYTETNGWNTAFAAPHDPAGLAALHGGRAALVAKLDEFFRVPERGGPPGDYAAVIHEVSEARDVRMGQYGHSNQPSHHIPYLYAAAGEPARTQAVVREVLSRLYLGGEIGQGYPGDEDNGEMSAWYVLSALGLYPLRVGSPEYVVGSPLFTRATVHLPGENELVISAPNNGPRNIYVQGLRVNGTPHTSVTLPHSAIASGGLLEFDMGPEPSAWGTGDRDEPVAVPAPLVDLVTTVRCSDGTDPVPLVDDTTRTEVRFGTATPVVEFTVTESGPPLRMYTLTSGSRAGDPSSWVLEGSADGTEWTVLDERLDQVFRWRRQTRAFGVPEPAAFRHYRLRVTACTRPRPRLAQVELLAGDGR
ncbi:alpha-1,2-mannosidase, putative [Amycolatopsis arida]|uniref:Alpha-1,2-mannosidase, putative n=1 Tax=Amycolatopsis arida TaxID=587909 RepID=A0A1I5ZE84_9PSEU|nr:GH92 family glycosyl hydrolase [Amycolatopsis arida]TDX89570.1 putative alpha-1,2-mannosidase [Amycolatopsis arida]SFQ54728.1 alpha-1,2-mannosidase, putative [Amycolatopsis arida]